MKSYIKAALQFTFLIVCSPIFASYLILKLFLGESLFASYSQFLSLFPGKLGCFLRTAFYRMTMTACHKDTVISFGTLFSQIDTEIQEGVYIGAHCNIGMSKISKGTLLGSGVHIMSGKRQHSFDQLDVPIQQQGGEFEKVSIGEDSWLGNGSLIMANVGKKCIVGAGSVVVDDVEDYSIVGGNPARLIKKRTRKPSDS